MLTIINRYAHGVVVIPTIAACKAKGVFSLFETHSNTLSLDQIARMVNANTGHLAVAFRSLESMSWVTKSHQGFYHLTGAAQLHHYIPDNIAELLEFPMMDYIHGDSNHNLEIWIKKSCDRWGCPSNEFADFLDGLLLVPLLIALREKCGLGMDNSQLALKSALIPANVLNAVQKLFTAKNWIAQDYTLNSIGSFMVKRIFSTATVASYLPMLRQMPELLFGDPKNVLKRNFEGNEEYVNRTLNVIGSGFQHEKYFSAIDELILSIFNELPFSAQPKYIADMGCGDGALLKRIYKCIGKSKRGKELQQYPITLIAADFNEQSLAASQKTLLGLNPILIKADIGNPQQFIQDLSEIGIDDPENILHIRSFLDHDRPYIPPANKDNAELRKSQPNYGVYVDNEGNSIPQNEAVQSLVEHLSRWSSIELKYGIIILEVHCLESAVVSQYLGESESLHFDAYHGFSKQYLVSASDFLLSAAEVGLFPMAAFIKKYPKTLPFSRITLNYFKKAPYSIRLPNHADVDALLYLESICRPLDKQTQLDQLRARLEQYPDKQFVISTKDEVVGVAYFSLIDESSNLSPSFSDETFKLEVDYCNVLPEFDAAYKKALLDFVECFGALDNKTKPLPQDIKLINELLGKKTECEIISEKLNNFISTYPIHESDNVLYPERELEVFASRWFVKLLQDRGLLRQAGESWPASVLKSHLHVMPKYYPLFDTLLLSMEKLGIIEVHVDQVVALGAIENYALPDVDNTVEEFKSSFLVRYPGFTSFLVFMEATLSEYLSILDGSKSINDIVFPNASMEIFENIFKGDKVSDYFNHVLAEAIYNKVVIARSNSSVQKLRILEIGSGTGAATEQVLKKLKPLLDDTDFFYTDISSSFVRYGKKRFELEYPGLNYVVLDIEADLIGQGFAPGSFDIIFASNVLHDTADIKSTLLQARQLMRTGGLLIINEYTRAKDLLLYTGALLHGYWLFNDPQCRLENTCLLNVNLWDLAIKSCGFGEFQSYSLPFAKKPEGIDQSVMLAEAVICPETLFKNTTNIDAKPAQGASLESQKIDLASNEESKHIVSYRQLRDVKREVQRIVLSVLSDAKRKVFSSAIPLQELGFDSMELLEIRALLGKKFGKNLSPAFLFQYETVDAIAQYFDSLASHAHSAIGEFQLAGSKENSVSNIVDPVACETIESELENTFIHQSKYFTLVQDAVKTVFSHKHPGPIDPLIPLQELGLDSMELLEFRSILSKRTGKLLDPTFLFQHETVDAIVKYFLSFEASSASAPSTIDSHAFLQEESLYSQKENHDRSAAKNSNSILQSHKDAIAVVGISCRFPGEANTPEAFWEVLTGTQEVIGRISDKRWEWPSYIDIEGADFGIDFGGYLKHIDQFDAGFFRISPKEAESMDPQQRLLLELSWEALEDAGYPPSSLSGSSTGVFIGACHSDYRELFTNTESALAENAAFLGTSTIPSLLANRISYFYNFKGQSLTIDTACSSALVAINSALAALQRGECDQAMVGSINLISSPTNSIAYYHAGMLSREGKCNTFDSSAEGYVRGEGGGVLILKHLSKAIEDGDRIYGAILGAAVNHGGQATSLTAPRPDAQAQVIRNAYLDANIDPSTVTLIETHGTGTQLGDPIEVEGLKQAFAVGNSVFPASVIKNYSCALGAVKTKIGHLEAAAGLAGVIKVLLCFKNKKITANSNFSSLNSHISLDSSPFYISEKLHDWTVTSDDSGVEAPRRAGVSAFGLGGTNAHVVLQEYVDPIPPAASVAQIKRPLIIILSAKTMDQLQKQAAQLLVYLQGLAALDLNDLANVAYTLQIGREHLNVRLAFLIRSSADFIENLQFFLGEGATNGGGIFSGSTKKNNEILTVLDQEDFKQIIDKSFRDENYSKILRFWVSGIDVNWRRLYQNNKPKKISLPCYAFSKDRYWFNSLDKNKSKSANIAISNVHVELDVQSSVDKNFLEKDNCEMLLPVWQELSLDVINKGSFMPNSFSGKLLIVGGTQNEQKGIIEKFPASVVFPEASQWSVADIVKYIGAIGHVNNVLWLMPKSSGRPLLSETIVEDQQKGVLFCFRFLKALLTLGYGEKKLSLTVVTFQTQAVFHNGKADPCHSGIHGFIGVIAKEYPSWAIRLVDLDIQDVFDVDSVFSLPANVQGSAIAVREGRFYHQVLAHIQPPELKEINCYRHKGVYVVIGGASGIGAAWSEWMIKNFQAKIVWIGRRPFDQVINEKITALSLLGQPPLYISADASNYDQLSSAYQTIKKEFSHVHGVIHSALVLRDKSFANMDQRDFTETFESKVNVSVNLASIFQHESLDFILFFSSMTSFTKPAGQSNYASGCTFKDSYATQLAQERSCLVKVINWGYWGSIGSVATKSFRDRMARAGFGSIELEEAMPAIQLLLSSPLNEMVFIKKTRENPLPNTVSTIAITHPECPPLVGMMSRLSSMSSLIDYHEEPSMVKSLDDMDRLMALLLLANLQAVGIFDKPNLSILEIKHSLKLRDLHRKWFDESLAILVKMNLLEIGLNNVLLLRSPQLNIDVIWQEWNKNRSKWLGFLQLKAKVILVEKVLQVLPEILLGKKFINNLLFPHGSMQLVEGVYRNNPISDYFNDVLGESLVNLIDECLRRSPSYKVRILEVGAGTGGTSSKIFNLLKAYENNIEEYAYTDISKSFLIHGEENFSILAPYATYKIFDVSRSVDEQGIDAGGYDFIIATNVLHATKDIRKTLRNCKSCLKGNGVILLNEICFNTTFYHLTFGFLDGWWLYDDSSLRIPGCPALKPESWQEVLETEGLKSAIFPAFNFHYLGQQIVVAQSDGISHIAKEGLVNSIGPVVECVQVTNAENVSQEKSNHVNVMDGLLDILLGHLSTALKVVKSEIDIDESFRDYGLDSISGINFILAINNHLNIHLATICLFDYTSVTLLATHILNKYSAQVEAEILAFNPSKSITSVQCQQPSTFASIAQRPAMVSYPIDEITAIDILKDYLCNNLSASLKIDISEIKTDISFRDYGLDSISGIGFVKKINKDFKLTLETICLFDYSSIDQLAEFIILSHKEILIALADKQPVLDNKENNQDRSNNTEHLHASLSSVFNSFAVSDSSNTAQQIDESTSIPKSSLFEPIAIIGMSGRFADADCVDELWEVLVNGLDLVKPITRWDLSLYDSASFSNTYCKHGGLLPAIDKFDATFFNISGIEAIYMDPQQRLLLEESWSALEDAGYASKDASALKKCGVYIGCRHGDYHSVLREDSPAQALWGNSASVIPARISYFLNLQGPAVAIDTACSSSLVAIHLACQSLWNKETELALAGGVFLQSNPWFYVTGNRAKMLSPSGKCHAFDESADGFVPGEGVGVLVLKPLDQAVNDGDHVYGIIRGTGINQDGTTNGITAPSMKSQERLERQVYDTFNIDPEQIQMIEAHGTGTTLGDPIEFTALNNAFRAYTNKQHYCALGSIKTNIGHAAPAAGVAGVIKILLSLKHKKIPPSLHFCKPNKNIFFDGSPFYVNTKIKPWDAEVSHTRNAAISSFGFSGTNAHMVIGEAPVNYRIYSYKPAYLIVLSAMSKTQLDIQVKNLLGFIETNPALDLGNLSFTLFVGRSHFSHRLACVVSSLEDFYLFATEWLRSSKHEEIFSANLESEKFREQTEIRDFGNQLILSCANGVENYLDSLKKIADLFIKGYRLNYKNLFNDGGYSRVSLPTYPFMRDSFWVPEGAEVPAVNAANNVILNKTILPVAELIHPFLQKNYLNNHFQQFSSTFSCYDFWLADHVVRGSCTLPGVVYLEMVHAAISHSEEIKNQCVHLKNIVWASPIVVGNTPLEVHIRLIPLDDEYNFEIFTVNPLSNEETIRSKGGVGLRQEMVVADLNIAVLKSLANERQYNAQACYDIFSAMGIQYGPCHQGIRQVMVGKDENGNSFAFAELELPKELMEKNSEFILHSSIADSALQASVGLLQYENVTNPVVPFALEQVNIYKKCEARMWARVKYSKGCKPGDPVQKLDIDICDSHGTVCVQFLGFSSRSFPFPGLDGTDKFKDSLKNNDFNSDENVQNQAINGNVATLVFHQAWVDLANINLEREIYCDNHYVVFCEPEKNFLSSITQDHIERTLLTGFGNIQFQWLGTQEIFIDKRYQDYAIKVLSHIKSILQLKLTKPSLYQLVIYNCDMPSSRMLIGLEGLLKTARLENPNFIGQLVAISGSENISEKIQSAAFHSDFSLVFHDGNRSLGQKWLSNELPLGAYTIDVPWKDGGRYIITGGVGGLGLIFAEAIAKSVTAPHIILIGRSNLNVTAKEKLDKLSRLGARVDYRQVDVSNRAAVFELVNEFCTENSIIHGVIHSAGVTRDDFIINKTADQLCEVFRAKVSGCVNLDEATAELKIDQFIVFSSVAGALGNVGQADYAAANSFMDVYVSYRNDLSKQGLRNGKALSINWPLWMEGGMVVDDLKQESLLKNLGMLPLETLNGIGSLYYGLSEDHEQIMVIEGYVNQIVAAVNAKKSQVAQVNSHGDQAEIVDSTTELIALDVEKVSWLKNAKQNAVSYFKKVLSRVLKISVDRIDALADFERYGIDSILVMQLTTELENDFGLLSKTLFFEYQNINELADYFLTAHSERLKVILNIQDATAQNPQSALVKSNVASLAFDINDMRKIGDDLKSKPIYSNKDIAIIGIAGRYPQAESLDELWENLKSGKDCITEIPRERWDHTPYFDHDKTKPGKSNSRWGGFISGVDQFDPLLFNISPREAELMDPQERLFLESVHQVMEDAGYTREALNRQGTVGVYVGVMYEEYQLFAAQEQILGNPIALAGSPASIANRVSYYCNFNGPSLAIDSMCSSSLSAMHIARHSLLCGECDVAIVGGVNITIHPNKYLVLARGNFASSKGRCESFGEGGDGYVPSEGVGSLMLKPLEKAQNDGDHIYGVIKGTAINHGGKTNGYTVPNPKAQSNVITTALKEAGVDARALSYVEAHGTGTFLGDPIEVTGLTSAFRHSTQDNQFCALGSIKSNIGHCESASGIAGITKILLQMKHRQLVASIHSQVTNPNIDFLNTPFFVQQNLEEWRRPTLHINGVAQVLPRIAGLSSFGAGGSNAHAIIEEYCPVNIETQNVHSIPAIILFSAKSREQLRVQAKNLLHALNCKDHLKILDIAFTLQVGRESMEERVAFLGYSKADLQDTLNKFISSSPDGDIPKDIYSGTVKSNKDIISTFGSDDDFESLVSSWIEKGKYEKLIELWVKGFHIDWYEIYKDSFLPSRVSLPTYPFNKQRYWLPSDILNNNFRAQVEQNQPIASSIERKKNIVNELQAENFRNEIFCLNKKWELIPHSFSGSKSSKSQVINSGVVIFSNKETEDAAQALGKVFSLCKIINIEYAVSPAIKEMDFSHYLNAVDITGCSSVSSTAYYWIEYLQCFIDQRSRATINLLCVTKGLEAVDDKTSNISGATQAALYRMLSHEYAHIYSRHIDTDWSVNSGLFVSNVVDELLLTDRYSEICYRDGNKYRAILDKIQTKDDFLSKTKGIDPNLLFKHNEVLLVTGGTRGIGLLCARHWVKYYGVKRLVLTGKEKIPPRNEWDEFLRSEPSSSLAAKINDFLALEAQGVKLLVLNLPLDNDSALDDCIQNIKMEMGPIAGVFHCAGTVDSHTPAFIRKSPETIRRVFEPKIQGAQALINIFKLESIRFFVLFSSVAGTLPTLSVGQSDYAMANGYMDYLAQLNHSHMPIVSVQWPNWQQTGMGEVTNRAYLQSGLKGLSDELGLRLLQEILTGDFAPVVLPAYIDNTLWNDKKSSIFTIPERIDPVVDVVHSVKKPAPDSSQLKKLTIFWLLGLFSQELKIAVEELDEETHFQDYGVDSILLVQILIAINKAIDAEIDPSIVYEHSTIKDFANFLIDKYSIKLAAALNSSEFSDISSPIIEELMDIQKSLHLNVVAESRPLEKEKSSNNILAAHASGDIAIVGMSCRFPGAENLDEYWNLLLQGGNAIKPVPDSRWGYANSYCAGLLADINNFDPNFFNISIVDAQAMDAQARILLEESIKLCHHAGYSIGDMKDKPIGVYIGGRGQNVAQDSELAQVKNPILVAGQNYLASNISQFLNLKGPSLVIDTACSSALIAMQIATQALRNGDVTAAIVGGVNILSTDRAHKIFELRGILNREPAFHLFDNRSAGVIPSEGVGMVMLKTVDQAIADGDSIYALLKDIASNNDGKTVGPVSPNFESQKEVMQQALRKSGIDPYKVSHIEVNGSGSEVTDLLELKAIQSVYRYDSNITCGLGSIKPNIGHPLCAEGIASFIKLVLMLHNRRQVPFLSGQQPMKHFDLNASPFYFLRQSEAFNEDIRFVGLNCFADGGTNVHAILQSWIGQNTNQIEHKPLPLPLFNLRNMKERNIDAVVDNIATKVAIHSKDPYQEIFWEMFR